MTIGVKERDLSYYDFGGKIVNNQNLKLFANNSKYITDTRKHKVYMSFIGNMNVSLSLQNITARETYYA